MGSRCFRQVLGRFRWWYGLYGIRFETPGKGIELNGREREREGGLRVWMTHEEREFELWQGQREDDDGDGDAVTRGTMGTMRGRGRDEQSKRSQIRRGFGGRDEKQAMRGGFRTSAASGRFAADRLAALLLCCIIWSGSGRDSGGVKLPHLDCYHYPTIPLHYNQPWKGREKGPGPGPGASSMARWPHAQNAQNAEKWVGRPILTPSAPSPSVPSDLSRWRRGDEA